jgi:8-oxo-dGTP diphosphatase
MANLVENLIDQRIFDKKCNFHGAKGVVFINNKILVYRRDNKTNIFPLCIDLPGGGKEEGESPFDTLKRETREEFGIEINEKDVEYAKEFRTTLNPTKESYLILVRPLNIKEDDIIFGNEGLEFMLMRPDEYVVLNDGIKRQQDEVLRYLDILKK